MLDRSRPIYGDPVPPPLNRQGIENAQAIIRKIAEHFIGTDEGRAFGECARLLSKLEIIPESSGERQRERGYRLRHLRINEARYVGCTGDRTFARAFVDDAKHYLRHRSQYDDKQTGRPLRDPWLSVSHIIDLCGGEVPHLDTIRRDIRK
ncbi:MAG: hypothetical protein EOQ50_18460 [Mesorhizobium sp.]|uniref:hypothetical protein n=1 Tax=Mesorhizobium sp. TaxID=1871066 RepID=UPI000FE7309D|nr:hypothetical protein [Mesorhizobium sp.]RWB72951.1 MAG: hypothetical protein EOQ50_18460 [Mesorhizobium sp.]